VVGGLVWELRKRVVISGSRFVQETGVATRGGLN
jgi:hypothetical protein